MKVLALHNLKSITKTDCSCFRTVSDYESKQLSFWDTLLILYLPLQLSLTPAITFLSVARIEFCHDIKRAHHVMVFMLEDVTVVDIPPCKGTKLCDYSCHMSRRTLNCVLSTPFIGRRIFRLTRIPDPSGRHIFIDIERDTV